VFAAKIASAVVSVRVAVSVPELVAVAVNVVVPHPYGTGVAREAITALGMMMDKESPIDRYVFSSNVKETDVGQVVPDDVKGLAMSNALYLNCALYNIAVDALIAVSGMSVIAVNDTDILRDARFISCAIVPVVIPDPNVTVHCVPGSRIAAAEVRCNLEVAVPEFEVLEVNEVVPQLVTVADDKEAYDHDGSFSVMTSPIVKGTLKAKANDISDGACVTSFDTEIMLNVTAGVGIFTAVDAAMAVAARLLALAKVAMTLRVFKFEICS